MSQRSRGRPGWAIDVSCEFNRCGTATSAVQPSGRSILLIEGHYWEKLDVGDTELAEVRNLLD